MKKHILPFCLLVGFAQASLALDASPAVRVTPLLKTQESWDGQPIRYPQGKPEVVMLHIEIAPGGQTGWHEHDVPSFAHVLEGELEVTQADGRKRRLGPGDSLAEVVGVIHNGRVLGERAVKLVVVYTSAEGYPLSRPHPEFVPPAGR